MITIKSIEKAVNVKPIAPAQDTIDLLLFCDELSELSDLDLVSLGIPETTVLQEGSRAYDKTGSVAILDSTGTWNTIGD